jgi:hypothetical protein
VGAQRRAGAAPTLVAFDPAHGAGPPTAECAGTQHPILPPLKASDRLLSGRLAMAPGLAAGRYTVPTPDGLSGCCAGGARRPARRRGYYPPARSHEAVSGSHRRIRRGHLAMAWTAAVVLSVEEAVLPLLRDPEWASWSDRELRGAAAWGLTSWAGCARSHLSLNDRYRRNEPTRARAPSTNRTPPASTRNARRPSLAVSTSDAPHAPVTAAEAAKRAPGPGAFRSTPVRCKAGRASLRQCGGWCGG